MAGGECRERTTIKRRICVFVAHIFVVTMYLCLGGLCLQALEEPHEMSTRAEHVRLVRDLLQQGNISADLERALHDGGVCDFSFLEDDTFKKKWTLSGSTFFSLTVITTIGYGNQVPSTYNGKSFTTFYAIIGIGVVSQLLGSCAATLIGILRGIGQRLLKYMPCLRVCVGDANGPVGGRATEGADCDDSWEAWGVLWDSVVGADGICDVSSLPDLIGKLTEDLTADNADFRRHVRQHSDEGGQLMQYVKSEADRTGDGSITASDLTRAVALYYATAATLPKKVGAKNLLTLLSVCAVWACVWAFAFSVIEGWNYRNSLWFCVVTMSTIGFGDFTPETSAGRGMAYLFIITGLGLAATALGAVWEYFEARRFWLLQKHGSPKLIEAHEISVRLKSRWRGGTRRRGGNLASTRLHPAAAGMPGSYSSLKSLVASPTSPGSPLAETGSYPAATTSVSPPRDSVSFNNGASPLQHQHRSLVLDTLPKAGGGGGSSGGGLTRDLDITSVHSCVSPLATPLLPGSVSWASPPRPQAAQRRSAFASSDELLPHSRAAGSNNWLLSDTIGSGTGKSFATPTLWDATGRSQQSKTTLSVVVEKETGENRGLLEEGAVAL